MIKFLLLLLSLNLAAGLTMAQKKTNTAHRRPAASTPAKGGRDFNFSDGILISGLPSNTNDLLLQKGFKPDIKDQEARHETDTVIYTDGSGEKLYFFYSPMYGYIPAVLFLTTAAGKARQLMTEALKDGFHAVDSMELATGNEEQSSLIYKVRYSKQLPAHVPPAYNALNHFFTTQEAPLRMGKLYAFYFSSEGRNEIAVVEPNPNPEGVMPPGLRKEETGSRTVDTLTFEPGKPVLLFVETGSTGPYYGQKGEQDSVEFFKKRNFNSTSFKELMRAYPEDLNRYVYVYKPTLIRYRNSRKETDYYAPDSQHSGFVYWSGKATDVVVRHEAWKQALYVVANASGDNQRRAGYPAFLKDSLIVDRIRNQPAYRPFPKMLSQMNYFILSSIWEEELLLLPLLDITKARRIVVSGKQSTLHYHFNPQGQLDSLVSQADDRFFSRSTRSIAYKNGMPVTVYAPRDSVQLSYDADTLMVQRKGRVQRYLFSGRSFHLIDNFETSAANYLRNNIRDREHGCYNVDLEPVSEKDAAGNMLINIRPCFENIKGKYVFRKGILQQIELTNRNPDIAGRYYVFIQRYP